MYLDLDAIVSSDEDGDGTQRLDQPHKTIRYGFNS